MSAVAISRSEAVASTQNTFLSDLNSAKVVMPGSGTVVIILDSESCLPINPRLEALDDSTLEPSF